MFIAAEVFIISTFRLLKQVAQVYQSVSMKRLLALAKFSTHHHLERLVVECARNNDMQVTMADNRDQISVMILDKHMSENYV